MLLIRIFQPDFEIISILFESFIFIYIY